MGRDNAVGALDCAVSTIGGKDHNGSQSRLQSSMEVRETLNVQHVNLEEEQRGRELTIVNDYGVDRRCKSI